MSRSWNAAFAAYLDRRVLMVVLVGFSSGLPLALTYSTLSAWLAGEGISRTTIGLLALVGTSYNLKFLWSPLIDRMPLPLLTRLLGRRRSWGLLIQALLMVAILALGASDPVHHIAVTATLAVVVAFLSASQDIVLDAYRVELLDEDQQGPGAGAVQAGYRLAMLASGAGAMLVAGRFGWFTAYATMAALVGLGMAVLLLGPEPKIRLSPATAQREIMAARYLANRPHLRGRAAQVLAWLHGAVVCPFADFMARPVWWAVLLFIIGYKMGEAMAGAMANPLYIDLGFKLDEIAYVSKVFGFAATMAGIILGGALVARLGVMRALLVFGVLQSLGNLAYVLQAMAGHDLGALALCVFTENLTAGMAASALVTYLSEQCNLAYTATQYALLSSLTALGRTVFASGSGWLADRLGWVDFFLLTTIVTLPALLLLPWLMRQQGRVAPKPS